MLPLISYMASVNLVAFPRNPCIKSGLRYSIQCGMSTVRACTVADDSGIYYVDNRTANNQGRVDAMDT